ncbi:MAG: EAL domain-containing protein [Ruminococcaceae bacterium]|nr:EAL domain-containing protein [Oscillospiraceae bacterium]
MVVDLKTIYAPSDRVLPVSLLMQLSLAPFDMLLELDAAHRRVRCLRQTEGKFAAAVTDGSFWDVFRHSGEYLIHPDDRETYLAAYDPDTLLQRLRESETPGVLQTAYRRKVPKGGWHRVEVMIVGGEENGVPEGVAYAFVFDVEERPAAETYDGEGTSALRSELTGLLWEEPFFERAGELMRDRSERWNMIVFDLEHFKLFNEWYGRTQGDMLLAKIGAQLLRIEEECGALACYFGQDDFGLLAPWDMERINRLYEEIHALIAQYGASVCFLPAFGVSAVDAGTTAEEACDRAAMAALRAKDDYHERIREFDPAMFEKTDRDYRVLSDFQTALRDGELTFYLQPQCKISTQRVVGAESLVRWKKADGTMVSPGVFVPVLEEYGFITDMDRFVWEQVCAWQRRWIDGGHTPLPISVNVSQIDIFTIDVPEHFETLLRRYDLPVETIKIEITESAYVDNDSVADAVRRLREKGFLVLMDDFGSGYSSLNMLRNLNIDVIKLDAQFLRMAGDDRKGVQIVESIVNMARSMSVPIIAEGVEEKREIDFLSGLGCRYVQGYYFYRPMPVEDFEKLIADPEKIDTGGFRFKLKDQFHTREFLDKNIFSDAMLNNILGPAAFFSLRDGELDAVRFNRQFLEEIRAPEFREHTVSIQKQLVPEDLPVLYDMLERAVSDPFGGSGGVLHVMLPDGALSQLRVRLFFLEEDENGKRFYGSARDITQLVRLNDRMDMLTNLSPDSAVFLRRTGGGLNFRTVTHGLQGALGLDREALERELNDGSFRERLDPREREALMQEVTASGMRMKNFSAPFRVRTADGRTVRLRLRFDAVHDRESGVDYIMLLRLSEK